MNNAADEMTRKARQDGSIDKAKGHANETIGKIKEKVGSLIGDHELEAKGTAQNAQGKAQRAKGEVKEAIDDVANKVMAGAEVISDKIKEVLHKK